MARISILTPVYRPDPARFDACIASVVGQVNTDWQWCITDDGSGEEWIVERLNALSSSDPRVDVFHRSENGGIVQASADSLARATAEWVVLLDHDDELVWDALDCLVRVIDSTEDADFIYSDEALVDESGAIIDTFEKPAWSPSRLRSQMYTGHLAAYRTSVVRLVGGFREGFDGAQDYDLALRVSEVARRVIHIPKPLYRWVAGEASVVNNPDAKRWAYEAGVRAVQAHCERVGIDAVVEETEMPGVHRLRDRSQESPLISIIIPTRGTVGIAFGRRESMVLRSVRSIVDNSSYTNYEIICVCDETTPRTVVTALRSMHDRLRIIMFDEPFNFSRKINLGVFFAGGDRLLLVNDDVEVVTPDWIEAMLRPISEGDVGIVGAKLLFEDSTIQHAGQFMDHLPHHVLVGLPGHLPGPMSTLLVERECQGVTAACALIRRDVFERVGGFTERLPNNYNDVDFCLKVREAGMRIVWTPFAELFHFESSSRDATVTDDEIDFLKRRWKSQLENDPYFTPAHMRPRWSWNPPESR